MNAVDRNSPPPAMDEAIAPRRRRRWPVVAIAAAVAIAVVLAARLGRAELSVPARDVLTAPVERGDFVNEVAAYGKLVASRQLVLSAPVAGRVEEVVRKAGARVREGDVILRLSSPEVDAAANSAEAELAIARADLSATRAKQLEAEENLRSEVDRTELEAKSLELEVGAERLLLSKQAISTIAAKRTELQYELHRNALQRINARLDQLRVAHRTEIDASMLKLRKLEEIAESERARRDALTIRAAFDGVLANVDALPGQMVAAGASLGVLIDPARLQARLQVAEREARLLKIGQAVRVSSSSGDFGARLSRIDPSVTQGMVTADADFIASLPSELRADLAIDARIEIERLPGVLSVSRPNGIDAPGRRRVFVVADGHAVAREVVFGTLSTDRAVVADGLRPGERIVVSDTSPWRDQQRITLE